jgi:RNA polymerase sigma factor (sigma-70 family)
VAPADDLCRGRISKPAEAAASVASGLATIRVAADTGTGDQLIADLFRGHRLALIRVALALVGDRPTAEDVVQDAFTGLYRAMPRLRDPGNALGYLRTSVVNGCRSVHRARQRALLSRRHHVTAAWSAESAVLAREESRLALQAVARLPRRAREILALRYLLDLPDADIAAALGISKATVSSTASRALAALARDLKEPL